MASGDREQISQRRIRHARQTTAALQRVLREPTPTNIAALHELHAHHLRELGDEAAAALAEERAIRARRLAADQDGSPSFTAIFRTVHGAHGQLPRDHGADRGHRPTVDEDRSPDAARGNVAGRAPASGASQVQQARAGLERADGALQRAAEAFERTDAYAGREKAARERSGAARRRLRAAETRAAASQLRSQLRDHAETADERDRIADEREHTADERERIADERDSRADLRDKIADKRDRTADDRDRTADERDRSSDEGRAHRG